MNTKGDRLKHAMSLLRLNQSDVAGVLGIKQPGVSERLRNLRELTFTDAVKLEEHYGIRPDWLLRADGPIFKPGNLAEEGMHVYASLRVDTSEDAISKRFIGVVSAYTNNNRLQEKEAAALLHLSESHWSQIKRGGKGLTITMLAHAVLNMDADANFILASIDTGLSALNKFKKQVEALEKEKENMQLTIDLMRDKLESMTKDDTAKKRA